MIAAIVVIMLFFTWATDGAYLSARNISNLLRQTAITGILAVGMVFVIISAEIDLSVGSMMGLLGGAAAIFDVWLGWPLPLTIAVTLVMGLLLGAWNGWWVAYRKVPSFIVTLAGMLAFRGILIGITNGTTVSPPARRCRKSAKAICLMALVSASALSAWRPLLSGSGADGCAVRRWVGHRANLAGGRQALPRLLCWAPSGC
jgi:ABC-type xylose transport system permease subunit